MYSAKPWTIRQYAGFSAESAVAARDQDIFGFTAGRMPRFNSISVSGYHMGGRRRRRLELAFRDRGRTSGYSLTAQAPQQRRAPALEAPPPSTAAPSRCTSAFGEAIALPTEHSARVARAARLMIQEETGVTRVAGLGRSYFMEALTSQLADKAREIIADVDAAGACARWSSPARRSARRTRRRSRRASTRASTSSWA
ncbi:methylmalonyl-CoA mutase [Aureococcus anophagefferens]|nr:methylmalonyl-CoA mutase [Aureococcus anophagefferens]